MDLPLSELAWLVPAWIICTPVLVACVAMLRATRVHDEPTSVYFTSSGMAESHRSRDPR